MKKSRFRLHRTQVVVAGFAVAILIGTALLMLPNAKLGVGGASFLEALFTATSAVCVTGLIIVDTATYWTPFGQIVILLLIQIGGFGIMTFASVIGLAVVRKMSLRSRITAATEAKSVGLEDIKGLVLGVVGISVIVEFVVAVLLSLRFMVGYGEPVGRALWLGCSIRCRRSTTPDSRSSATTSSPMRRIHSSLSRSAWRSFSAVLVSP